MANIEQFGELLEKGKLDDAAKTLGDFIDTGLSSEERGKALTMIMYAYIKCSNEMSDAYISNLEEMEELLKEAGEVRKEMEEEIKLDDVRAALEA